VNVEFTVPLCRIHHRLVHNMGNEAAWWQDSGIDPVEAAAQLWNGTRFHGGTRRLACSPRVSESRSKIVTAR
jgi:hypothetical protein